MDRSWNWSHYKYVCSPWTAAWGNLHWYVWLLKPLPMKRRPVYKVARLLSSSSGYSPFNSVYTRNGFKFAVGVWAPIEREDTGRMVMGNPIINSFVHISILQHSEILSKDQTADSLYMDWVTSTGTPRKLGKRRCGGFSHKAGWHAQLIQFILGPTSVRWSLVQVGLPNSEHGASHVTMGSMLLMSVLSLWITRSIVELPWTKHTSVCETCPVSLLIRKGMGKRDRRRVPRSSKPTMRSISRATSCWLILGVRGEVDVLKEPISTIWKIVIGRHRSGQEIKFDGFGECISGWCPKKSSADWLRTIML